MILQLAWRITIVAIFTCFAQANAQNSYYEFKESYAPTNKLFSPDNGVVVAFKDKDVQTSASILQYCIKNNDLACFSLIILSLERQKAGKILDQMQPQYSIKGLQFIADKWVLDLMYYVSEKTYNDIGDKIAATRHYGILN